MYTQVSYIHSAVSLFETTVYSCRMCCLIAVYRDYDVISRRSIVHNKTYEKGHIDPHHREPIHPFDKPSSDSGCDAWRASLAGGLGCQNESERWEERSHGLDTERTPPGYSEEASKQYHESFVHIPRGDMTHGTPGWGQHIRLSRLMSCTVDFHAGDYNLTHLSGKNDAILCASGEILY